MKLKKFGILFVVLCIISCFFNVTNVYAFNDKVYLGGYSAGFSINTRGAYINGICDVVTDNGLVSPAKNAKLVVGDIIYAINETEVNSASDIEKKVVDGNDYALTVIRNYEPLTIKITPALDLSGKYRLGVLIRDKINGIGTVTYFKNNLIATLGHPVIDENGDLIKIVGGTVYDCNITGVIKGEKGKAGELRGVFKKNGEIGDIKENHLTGIYATNNKINKNLTEIEIGEAEMGAAEIYSTIEGCSPTKFDIAIVKVDKDNKDNKNFVIKITDKNLIEKTGGIVQGMSGSPIVQNGKIVGAITHVFINDPTRGFGIAIEKMLNH